MKPDRPKDKREPNEGEGNRTAARRYNRRAREFVAEGEVDEAAREAKDFVEHDPAEAERAEKSAKRGPHKVRGPRVSVDELVAKSRTVVDRVRPIVKRTIAKVRSRLSRAKSK